MKSEKLLQRVCVFAGSAAGARPAYEEAVEKLGRALAKRGCGLVYGGGKTGLMGVISSTVMKAGGDVIGVVPHSLFRAEVIHDGLADLRVVESMHERKATMADLADAFVAVPGGIGTLEELAEVLTWSQLGIHGKPCGLLNVAGYYDPLLEFLNRAITEGFLRERHRHLLIVDDDPEGLLRRLEPRGASE